jgi:hypothetical protein
LLIQTKLTLTNELENQWAPQVHRHIYEAKSTPTATGIAKTEECPLPIAFAPLEEELALAGFALLLVEVPVGVTGLSVELMTGEVGDTETVAMPSSTSKYIP